MSSNEYKKTAFICIIMLSIVISSCERFLNEKPNKNIVTINSIRDLQALLDNTSPYSSIWTSAADEYYITTSVWSAKAKVDRDTYIWEETYSAPWTSSYALVYGYNVVLQEINRIEASKEELDYIKGQALALRAFAFYQIAQIYCPPYSSNASSELGIPLRLVPDVEVPSRRSSVEQTYSQIIADLKNAITLLPVKQIAINRPYRVSVYGILSRVYLSMRDYENAGYYADLYLKEQPQLMDFNKLDTLANPGIDKFNVETAFFSRVEDEQLPSEAAIIDTTLYHLYHPDDLRRAVYFQKRIDGTYMFKGSYAGQVGYLPFGGIATDEMYIIRAECHARAGRMTQAMDDLNFLLKTRWKNGTYLPLNVSNKEQALDIILVERRKELVYRTTRWTDLRRFNLEGKNISLKRVLDGVTYTLRPNDNRWVWLIPREVIAATGMQQNKR